MLWQRRGYSGIDDHETHTRLPRHDVDRRPACKEVQHHLRGDFLRIAGNALRDHTVVSGSNDDRLAAYRGPFGPEYARQLDGEFLQSPEAPGRFRELLLP